MTDMPEVPPELVVKYLTRTELGEALWRAAAAEATSEVLMQRIRQLEKPAEEKAAAGE